MLLRQSKFVTLPHGYAAVNEDTNACSYAILPLRVRLISQGCHVFLKRQNPRAL